MREMLSATHNSDQGYAFKFQRFQDLMQYKISEILVVASVYDLFLFEEDGRLYELLRSEYQNLELSQSPEIIRVSSAKEAHKVLKSNRKIDLVITTLHIADTDPVRFAQSVKHHHKEIPVVLLSFDSRELQNIIARKDISVFEKVFVWNGDYRLIVGIIKYIEDKYNVEHDVKSIGVQCVIVIEDNIKRYSSFLPIIYSEIIRQTRKVITEGINLSHKYLRMRARPKILLCSTYEEAKNYFKKYQENILGIISDIEFPKNETPNKKAGLIFAREVKKSFSDIPILLQSSDSKNKTEALETGCDFISKSAPDFNHYISNFMFHNFSFGDFIFKNPAGSEIARAENLKSFEEILRNIPGETIIYHGERNHFSNWLKARTEFWLADKIRHQKVSEFKNVEEIRRHLLSSLQQYKKIIQKGVVQDFSIETFDPSYSFARIGGGSIGGKARGLSFLNFLINYYGLGDKFRDIVIDVPSGIVIGTEVFDNFLDNNNLRKFAVECTDNNLIKEKFLKATFFPAPIIKSLKEFLALINVPLSVRSSSLLEDSQYHPFAGVYETFMLPNNELTEDERLETLINAIKLVFASTFYKESKDYFKMTSYNIDEEKMAVIVQKLVGSNHNSRFYPDISGVAKTYNFYPIPPQKTNDGIVYAALGLGKTIVEGGNTIKFSPKYPQHLVQFYSTKSFFQNNQREFFALDLENTANENGCYKQELFTKKYELKDAEKDGTLDMLGSTYSHENDMIYDGISRHGVRLVTFAPILKYKMFPLNEIISSLLEIGNRGMGTPVEIEFAVNLTGKIKEFGVLQMRPLVVSEEIENFNLSEIHKEDIFCKSEEVLGNGIIDNIKDIIYVDYDNFDRSKTKEIAAEISHLNSLLVAQNLNYLLIGFGRWGTLDPWLGIPVNWSQISGAKVIVEADLLDMSVEPSQGSHFFQNLTSFSISYFTIKSNKRKDHIDWEWLRGQSSLIHSPFVKYIKLHNPVTVKVNSHKKLGVIIKPKL